MLSARELDLGGNPNATGFVNQRIIFTHGVGVAMVPVNEVANEGQPRLFIRKKAKMCAQEEWTCKSDAARDAFGYLPEVPMEEGVRRALSWYKDAGWL